MRKSLLVALALGLSVAAIAPMVKAANPPETTDIACPGAKKTVKGFKHAEHAKHAETPAKGVTEKGCKVCHHKDEGKSCCDCHKLKKEGDAAALKDAMHKDCIDKCHKAAGKGPTKCEGCHGK